MRFMPTILLFIFYVMSFYSSTTVLVLNRQILVYQFNSLLVFYNIFSCFLSNSPRDYTNILIYNNLVLVNTNFISVICKIFVLCPPLSFVLYYHTNDIFKHYVNTDYNYCFMQVSFKLDKRNKKLQTKNLHHVLYLPTVVDRIMTPLENLVSQYLELVSILP